MVKPLHLHIHRKKFIFFTNVHFNISAKLGFLHSSVGKESACNAGDPGSIPESGRFPGEGIGCPLQCSWASLVAQLVKNPPAMRETWVRSLCWEDSPGEGKGYPLQYSGLENSMDCIVHGVAKRRTWLSNLHFLLLIFPFHTLESGSLSNLLEVT